jgi:N-acetylated-alpha-linked acidic dipeptidase
VTAEVPSPNQTVPGQTVFDLWDKNIHTMGSGSDFTAFQDFAGIPSVHIGFDAGYKAVYHYHSNYDSFHWMEKFGDPGFVYHKAMAQILGLMTAKLAEMPVIPFMATDYAKALDSYVKKVEDKLDAALHLPQVEEDLSVLAINDDEVYFELRSRAHNTSALTTTSSSSPPDAGSFKTHLRRLHHALEKLTERAMKLDKRAKHLELDFEGVPWWHWPARIKLALAIRNVNTKYKYLERAFLHEQGLDGRPWFKHVVFAPGLWTGYAGGKFSFFCFCYWTQSYPIQARLTMCDFQTSCLPWSDGEY